MFDHQVYMIFRTTRKGRKNLFQNKDGFKFKAFASVLVTGIEQSIHIEAHVCYEILDKKFHFCSHKLEHILKLIAKKTMIFWSIKIRNGSISHK